MLLFSSVINITIVTCQARGLALNIPEQGAGSSVTAIPPGEETEAQSKEALPAPRATPPHPMPKQPALCPPLPTMFPVCLSGRQWRAFRVAKSPWGPQENSNHSENNSNIRFWILNAYCTARPGRALPPSALTTHLLGRHHGPILQTRKLRPRGGSLAQGHAAG